MKMRQGRRLLVTREAGFILIKSGGFRPAAVFGGRIVSGNFQFCGGEAVLSLLHSPSVFGFCKPALPVSYQWHWRFLRQQLDAIPFMSGHTFFGTFLSNAGDFSAKDLIADLRLKALQPWVRLPVKAPVGLRHLVVQFRGARAKKSDIYSLPRNRPQKTQSPKMSSSAAPCQQARRRLI